jgi:hypothetical protein
MHRAKGHKTLCLVHAEQESQILDAEAVAEELIGPITKFQTALEINRALGHLFTLIAQKRISRHDGALLGFIAQLLHNNVGSTVKTELGQIEGTNTPAYWENNVRRALARLQQDSTISRNIPAVAQQENPENPEEAEDNGR